MNWNRIPIWVFFVGTFVLVAGMGAISSAMGSSDTTIELWMRCALGYCVLLGLAFLLSNNPKLVDRRILFWGVILQVGLAFIFLKTAGRGFFFFVDHIFGSLLGFTNEGTKFLFGSFVSGQVENGLVNFVFKVLPTIIFFASLLTVLYHLGVMQWIVGLFAWLMQKTLGTSGAETLSASSNIFLGQTEAPLLVKPFVSKMTRSELNAVMVGGFATIAGGVMAAYIAMLKDSFPDIAGHLMLASIMNAPAGLLLAKIICPEDGIPETRDKLKIHVEKIDSNVIGAAARGAGEGIMLAINIAAMLLAFIALVALLNAILGWCGGLFGYEALSIQKILGTIFSPIAWLVGSTANDMTTVGNLIGEKIALNEFVAYGDLANTIKANPAAMDPRSVLVASYALLGFANFSSIAIQIGGIGGLAPERRGDLAKLGLKAMIAGTMAALMSASLAAILTNPHLTLAGK